MSKNIGIRFTKFPFFFWGFGKVRECAVDSDKQELTILANNKTYLYKPMKKMYFYCLKFVLPLFVFIIIFSKYDFYVSDKNRLVAHIFALCLTTFFVLGNGFLRVGLIVAGAVFVGYIAFYTKNLALVSFVVKYICFYYVFILILMDIRIKPFCLIENDRVVSNFVVHKDERI